MIDHQMLHRLRHLLLSLTPSLPFNSEGQQQQNENTALLMKKKLIGSIFRIFAAYIGSSSIVRDFVLNEIGFPILFDSFPTSASASGHMDIDVIIWSSATKCLIDASACILASSEYCTKLSQARGISRLISLIQHTSNGPVRKNTAIVLARFCQNPVLKDEIKNLRGIEMLMAISKNT